MDYALIAIYLGLFLLLVLIGKAIYGWYHEIEKRNRYLEAQIRLLGRIAHANGMPEEEVLELYRNARIPFKYKKFENTSA